MTATLDTVRAARSLRHRRRARGLAVMAGLILAGFALTLSADGRQRKLAHEGGQNSKDIARLVDGLKAAGIGYHDISTRQSTLEDIFIQLMGQS